MTQAADCYAGFDLGTSGCRLMVIDAQVELLHEDRVSYEDGVEQTPELWWAAVQVLLDDLPGALHDRLAAVAVDGTSGTVLLTDAAGRPTSPALMYNDNRALAEAETVAALAPRNSGAHGATSGLAKLLWLLAQYPDPAHAHVLHQADWIAGQLAGAFGFSDENNCLKMGYDPVQRVWPAWLKTLVPEHLLPQVYEPGQAISLPRTAAVLDRRVRIRAGTTDSIAAFIATGADQIGEAVTSLGSTLALKILCEQPVFAPEFGWSPAGERWLAGGASNTGGAVLLVHFSREELAQLTEHLQPEQLTGLDYYPLLKPGERFPQADPHLSPRLSPRPENDVLFLQGMLEG
ncbi:MAG: FGGY family carbohydrate kinase [Thiolinea sp.]